MADWINKTIREYLIKRFDINVYPRRPEAYQLLKGVQLVSSVDDLLKVPLYIADTQASAAGVVNGLTCPAQKRRYILACRCSRATGDRTINVFRIGDPDSQMVDIVAFSADTNYRTGLLAQPLLMDEGWFLQMSITGGSTDGNWVWTAYALEEDRD